MSGLLRMERLHFLLMLLILAFAGQAHLHGQTTQAADSQSEPSAQDPRAILSAVVNEAAATGPTPQLVQQYHAAFSRLMASAESQLSTTPDQARASYEVLYQAMASPAGRQLFSQTPSASNFQSVAGQVSNNFAEANYQLARRMANDPNNRQLVQNLHAQAVSLTNRQNMNYLNALADTARINSDMQTAFNAFRAVVENPRSNPHQISVAREGLAKVATATNGALVMPDTTIATEPAAGSVTPQPGSMTPAIAVPGYDQEQPVITSAPSVEAEASNVSSMSWDSIWSSITSGRIIQDFPDIARAIFTSEVISIIIAVMALLLIFWLLPYHILKFLAKRGDTDAGDRLYRAKNLGVLSLVAYGYAKYTRAKETKHRCPFCNKSIDRMDDYNDMNFVVCPHCREPITPIYDMKDYISHLVEQLRLSQKMGKKRGCGNDVLIEKDAMLKLVRGVLALCIRRRASDLHLETHNEGGQVRARIDGIMYELLSLPREITPAFISALKVMANLDITERRIPQDGKIPLWMDHNDYDLRINTSPASMGEKVVIRILQQDAINITAEKLGLDGQNLIIYERNVNKPHGVIIVTGPSGSGKSTSLYVALNSLNTGDKNIVTIEDPIEYQLKGLSQMQVNPGANFTFATGLRSILRQDPDVIMVGEIRDKETAEAALDAAMTGHLVLTTLHTIDAPSAFNRLKDLGIDQARIASAVNLVMAQRLVRTMCSDCRKQYKPKAADLQTLKLDKVEDITYVHGTGCDTCMNTGYYGRLAVFEMLEMNDTIRSMMEENATTTALREAARNFGMRSLREEGVRQVRNGITTVEEVIRVTT